MPHKFGISLPALIQLLRRGCVPAVRYFSARCTSRRLLYGLLLHWMSFSAWAVDFTVIDLAGQTHKPSNYLGKWVVVNFWASWCPTCIQEIPELNAVASRPERVVLGLNIHDQLSNQDLIQVARHYSISYPVARATVTALRAFGPVQGLPLTYLINPDGVVVVRHPGAVTSSAIEHFIRANPLQSH